MTNSAAEQRLALARAVYPQRTWDAYGPNVIAPETYVRGLRVDPVDFTPESNTAQLLDVLCWLLKQDCCNSVDDDAVRAYPKGADEPKTIEHNSTPASLSDAVVRAAVRVVEGE